jgi:hypothetical protein
MDAGKKFKIFPPFNFASSSLEAERKFKLDSSYGHLSRLASKYHLQPITNSQE